MTEQTVKTERTGASPTQYAVLEEIPVSVVEEPFVSGSGYEDLWIWKKSMDLVDQIYVLTRSLPDDEKFGLKSQLRRAAVSVPSNIAEGYGRGKRGYFIQGLSIARGSLHEVETQVRICARQGFIAQENSRELLSLSGAISAAIVKLINKAK